MKLYHKISSSFRHNANFEIAFRWKHSTLKLLNVNLCFLTEVYLYFSYISAGESQVDLGEGKWVDYGGELEGKGWTCTVKTR